MPVSKIGELSPCSIVSGHFQVAMPKTAISVISWVNKPEIYEKHVLHSFDKGKQLNADIELVSVTTDACARNIGAAYNIGKRQAKHQIKAYLHQDFGILDRSWARKMDVMLSTPGVGAVGVIGSVVDTGGLFAFCHTQFQRGVWADSRFFNAECCPVKLVDGMAIITKLDFDFAECYEGPHMAIEDMCMQVREAGLQIWLAGSKWFHASSGNADAKFWRSMHTFRKRWKHMLPPDLPPVSMFQSLYAKYPHGFPKALLMQGGWDIVWQQWRRHTQLAKVAQRKQEMDL